MRSGKTLAMLEHLCAELMAQMVFFPFYPAKKWHIVGVTHHNYRKTTGRYNYAYYPSGPYGETYLYSWPTI